MALHLRFCGFHVIMRRLHRFPASRNTVSLLCQRRSRHSHNSLPLGFYSYLNHHPDERKPPVPYEIGSQFSAVACDPPENLLKHPCDWYIQAVDQVEDDLRNLPPLEACLRHPPAESKIGTPSVQLRVIDHIRVGDLENSQVLKVEASGLGAEADWQPQRHTPNTSQFMPTPNTVPDPAVVVAAKLYDPLYVDFDDCRPDPFHNCDAAFSLEAQAYRGLRPLYGTFVPHFYGSYTINVPLPDTTSDGPLNLGAQKLNGSLRRTRPVRAILYEYIPGTVLVKGMEMNMYNQSQRKEIMRALVSAESKTRQLDVLIERDFHPRNVVIKSAEEGKPADIRLIDFGAAQCGKRLKYEAHTPTTEPEPMSRIIERWRDYDDEWKDPANIRYAFYDLVDWDWDAWLRNDYASQLYQVKS